MRFSPRLRNTELCFGTDSFIAGTDVLVLSQSVKLLLALGSAGGTVAVRGGDISYHTVSAF